MSVESEIEQQGVVPDLLGVAEAAALLRVGLTFAYASTARFIATGSEKEIPAIKVGRLTRVPRAAFERFSGAPITWPIPVVDRPSSAGPLSVPSEVPALARSERAGGVVSEPVEAVADAAYAGLIEGREVLVMAPTNAVVDELNATLTERLLANGRLDETDRVDIAGCVFYPGQPAVTRGNNRTLRYGDGEWVRNGDRTTVNAGTSDELYLTSTDTGDRLALPAEYVAAGNPTVSYASTIHRAQGATVDEAYVIIDDRTNSRQLYVAATRSRRANHFHTATPTFDPDGHGPAHSREDWSPRDAVAAALNEQPDATSAIARRRQLRELVDDTRAQSRREQVNQQHGPNPTGNGSDQAAAAAERRRRFRIKRNGQSLGR